jgi:O-Antigen ligase
MAPIVLCVLAFIICYVVGRRSLSYGLVAVLAFGYAYGIVRANLRGTFSHFIFDAGVIGLYLSQKWFESRPREGSNDALRYWVAALIGWPLLICLLPFQTPLVSLVGLRGNAFLIPALILGSRLGTKDLMKLAYGLSILNLVALGFAGAEYFLGVERFYPLNEVTATIYASQDVAGYKFFRIPSTFVASAAYAGTMVVTLPFLYGAWSRPAESKWRSLLLLFGVVASLLGVLLGASRSHFIVAAAMVLTAVFLTRLSAAKQATCLLAIVALIGASFTNQRLQRFQSLSDKSMVADRIAGSVNRTFWEILSEYPMGNGLGGGGTSVPYFLQSEVRSPVTMENEYARILLEQGVIGLLIWVAFIFWALNRRNAFAKNSWQNGRRIAWTCCLCYFGTGLIGTGMLTAIPQSMLFLLLIGWIREPQLEDAQMRAPVRRGPPLRRAFVMPAPPRQEQFPRLS